MPFEKQEDHPEFRDDPPAFALEEVLLLQCGSADGEHFAGLKGFLAAIGRLGYSGAVVDRQVRRVCAGTDVVRKRLHLSQKSGVPAGHEVRIVLLPRTMLIHDLQQVPGAHGGDAQRAVGSDDFRLYIAACCMGAVGKEKAHGAVFALDHGGGIVCVMQFPTEVELKDTTDGPDVTDVRAGEPADQIQIVDAHVQELAARVGEEFQCGFNGAAGILGAGADQHHFADFTGVHTALGLSIGGVKPAHEAQLEHQFRMGLNNLFSFLALSHIGAQRLFTENVLAVLHGNFDLLHMKKRGGDDDDAVQLRIGAHGGKIGVSMRNAQFLCHRPETGGIHVTDGVEDAAGEVLSYFVYLNWLIMPVSGYVFGKLLKRMKDKDLFYRMAVPVCLLVAVPYYVLRIRNRIGMFGLGESCYYHVTTPDVLICLVTAIGMYGIYYFIGKHLPQKAVAAAYRIGADMTAFYFIHWLFVAGIVYLGLYLIRGTQILPMPGILVLAVLVTVVSLVLADLWMHKWKKAVFRK